MTHGSLFAGIGGFDLGFERAGIKTIWQVEIDEYCRRILARHFPLAERFSDVRNVGCHNLRGVDVISGGFPCQDISAAGKRTGIEGERSGLWSEMHRVICELRPRIVVVENVAALLDRGMGRVVGDLAASGYDSEWDCFSAGTFGAPHVRDRIWIIAHAEQSGFPADLLASRRAFSEGAERAREFWDVRRLHEPPRQHGRWLDAAPEARVAAAAWEHAPCEPLLLGVPDGISKRVERLRALGNANIPQIAEWIGRRILEVSA